MNNLKSQSWYKFLNDFDNLQIFALCKDFDNLSLDNNTEGSSSTSLAQPSSNENRSQYINLLHSLSHSLFSKSISVKLQVPFIEFPRHFIDSLSFKDYDISMNFCYRFQPGHNEFIFNEFKFPKCFDRLSLLSNSLGLSYNIRPLNEFSMNTHGCSGAGLRSVVTNKITRILAEVITYYEGRYGRFLVLVSLGIGCTVWYGYAPGSPYHAPDDSLFSPLESYDPFFYMDYYAPGFRRIGFVERNDVSTSVEGAFVNEAPFADITIPAEGPALKAVSIGVMVAFFLTVGLVPNFSDVINVQL